MRWPIQSPGSVAVNGRSRRWLCVSSGKLLISPRWSHLWSPGGLLRTPTCRKRLFARLCVERVKEDTKTGRRKKKNSLRPCASPFSSPRKPIEQASLSIDQSSSRKISSVRVSFPSLSTSFTTEIRDLASIMGFLSINVSDAHPRRHWWGAIRLKFYFLT